jgi:uncharacterized protein
MGSTLRLAVVLLSLGAAPVPALRERVTDQAALLPAAHRAALEAELERFERETSHQIAVLTVPSLEGEPIEDYSMRVVEAWKLGRGDVDNGILVVIASADRAWRIEVGYGLEGVVPDALAARIGREQMVPRFREGRMAEGIEAAVAALMQAARGEPIPTPAPAPPSGLDPLAVAFLMGLLGAFAASVVARRRRALRSGLGAALAGAAAWLLLASVAIGLLAAAIGAVLGLSSFSGVPRGRRGRSFAWLPRGGGFAGGRAGGFRGGGGGFGGGGASGRW